MFNTAFIDISKYFVIETQKRNNHIEEHHTFIGPEIWQLA
jgi:hypothetical protein